MCSSKDQRCFAHSVACVTVTHTWQGGSKHVLAVRSEKQNDAEDQGSVDRDACILTRKCRAFTMRDIMLNAVITQTVKHHASLSSTYTMENDAEPCEHRMYCSFKNRDQEKGRISFAHTLKSVIPFTSWIKLPPSLSSTRASHGSLCITATIEASLTKCILSSCRTEMLRRNHQISPKMPETAN